MIIVIYPAGLEIATNTVAFATKFVPFATKICRKFATYFLLFRNKRITSCQYAATLIK